MMIFAALLVVSGCATGPAPAGKNSKDGMDKSEPSLHVTVRDEAGNPVKDAVVYALQKVPPTQVHRTTMIVITNGVFHPFVTPAQRGDLLSFVNRDRVQHHIYSISAAKTIDLQLEKGASAGNLKLDKAGVVVLGCAMHDRMVGYVYVLDTPHFAKTGEGGTADLAGLPRGTWDVRVWHPRMKAAPETTGKRIESASHGRTNADFIITLNGRSDSGPTPSASLPADRGR